MISPLCWVEFSKMSHLASKQIYMHVMSCIQTEGAGTGKQRGSPNVVKSTSNCCELFQEWSAWPWINSVHYSHQRANTHFLRANPLRQRTRYPQQTTSGWLLSKKLSDILTSVIIGGCPDHHSSVRFFLYHLCAIDLLQKEPDIFI